MNTLFRTFFIKERTKNLNIGIFTIKIGTFIIPLILSGFLVFK